MKATKLPSGNYRVRVYMGEIDGKKLFTSVTANTRQEAMRKAYQVQEVKAAGDTFGIALNNYINSKAPVLSPSTTASYKLMQKRLESDFKKICSIPITQITKDDVQDVINALVASGNAPKTVRNFSGIISAVLRSNDVHIGQITLPQKATKKLVVPTEEEVKNILSTVRDTKMEIPVMLAAFAGLRRGEVCALKWTDIDFKKNIVHVSRDIVQGPDKKWHVKPPKTRASDRYIQLPENTIQRIKDIGEIPEFNPRTLTHRFKRIMDKLGYPYHFHTLRHFCASYMHSIGIPDSYIMQRCGWENDDVLKAIYRHTLADQEKKFVEITNSAFSQF